MTLRDWESRRTHQAWGAGYGNPSLMILVCLVVNAITLIVTVAMNATVVNKPDNDFSPNFGWALMVPAPVAGVAWSLIDAALCRFSVLHPIYYLTESALLFAFNAALGICSTLFFSWDNDGSWVPGMFMLFASIVYLTMLGTAARLVRKHKGILK